MPRRREKELSATERQQLKRGIEQAQGGLRAAADAAAPYAIGLNSRRRRNGFAPALPESEAVVAARAGSTGPASRSATRAGRTSGPGTRTGAGAGAVTVAAASSGAGRITADDTPGEPIRLTSIEGDAGSPSPGPRASSRLPRSRSPARSRR